jgi:DNA-binding IscR family transcriptional regulator
VRLARPANEIRSRDILEAIDGPGLFTECVLGLPGCRDDDPCPFHEHWAPERARLAELFESTSLAELSEGIRGNALRISAS